MSVESPTRYCRGCNTEVHDEEFGDYKQCGECRLNSVNRKRKSVTCECGRTLLACSLKIHLRSIYHAEHVKKAAVQHHPPQQAVKSAPPLATPIAAGTLVKPAVGPAKKSPPRSIAHQPRLTSQQLQTQKVASGART